MTILDYSTQLIKNQKEALLAFALALGAATLIKLPELFGIQLGQNEDFYLRNLSLFVLPLLTGYFVWKRKITSSVLTWLEITYLAAVLFANIYPFGPGSDTGMLLALHLPIALWLIVGIAFSGGKWNESLNRMNFIRFSGGLFIFYLLLALSGGVLIGFMAMIFQTIDIDIEPIFESWILPCGSTGAVIIAAWMVESRKSMTQNIAPVLARLFTPLFALMLITFLGALVWTGRAVDMERDMLIVFDLLLVVILALLLYGISARNPKSPPGAFDMAQALLVISALLVDLVALWAIADRITELGFTPNRLAALGMNIILLVNLAWSAVLYIRFLGRRGSFERIEQWQTKYLPVYALWAAIVVILFPPLFNFI